MTSLYGRYIKEREGKDILEYDDRFISYEINGDFICAFDAYVIPEKRKNGLFKSLIEEIEEIGRENKCSWILATVDPKDKNRERSTKALNSMGLFYWKFNSSLLWYKKEL